MQSWKSKITEIKYSWENHNSRFEFAERRISEIENSEVSIETLVWGIGRKT